MCTSSVVSESLRPPWTVACQAPLSTGFSRHEYWRELPYPSPGDPSDWETEPSFLAFPVLAGGLFTTAPQGSPNWLQSSWFLDSSFELVLSSYWFCYYWAPPQKKKTLTNTLIYIRNMCSNFLKITQWHYLTLRVLVFSLQNINNNFLRLLGSLNERCFHFSSQSSLNILI